MNAPQPALRHQRPGYRGMSPEGLLLSLIAEQATLISIRARLGQDGRCATMHEQAELIGAEAREEEIKAEFVRRVTAFLGTVKLSDLRERGVI